MARRKKYCKMAESANSKLNLGFNLKLLRQ